MLLTQKPVLCENKKQSVLLTQKPVPPPSSDKRWGENQGSRPLKHRAKQPIYNRQQSPSYVFLPKHYEHTIVKPSPERNRMLSSSIPNIVTKWWQMEGGNKAFLFFFNDTIMQGQQASVLSPQGHHMFWGNAVLTKNYAAAHLCVGIFFNGSCAKGGRGGEGRYVFRVATYSTRNTWCFFDRNHYTQSGARRVERHNLHQNQKFFFTEIIMTHTPCLVTSHSSHLPKH